MEHRVVSSIQILLAQHIFIFELVSFWTHQSCLLQELVVSECNTIRAISGCICNCNSGLHSLHRAQIQSVKVDK